MSRVKYLYFVHVSEYQVGFCRCLVCEAFFCEYLCIETPPLITVHITCSEIQLRSPNWLFGQRKLDENNSAPKVASDESANGGSKNDKRVDGLLDLNLFSYIGNNNEEDVFQRYVCGTLFLYLPKQT